MKSDIVEELFVKYYNDALLYTLSLSRNKSEAEDIVSTAFFKALTSADDSIESFKPWLLTVCRNGYFSLCRRRSRHAQAELTEELAEESEQLIEKLIRDEAYRALYRAIGLLQPVQKEVITLFYFENLPIRDIAQIVEKSEANVKVLLHRARENLKKILEVTQ